MKGLQKAIEKYMKGNRFALVNYWTPTGGYVRSVWMKGHNTLGNDDKRIGQSAVLYNADIEPQSGRFTISQVMLSGELKDLS